MSQMTSSARVAARALSRPVRTTPRLRVVTGAPLRRGGAAFGVICALLLATGLIALLLLNTALAQGSFTLQKLQSTSDQLADTQAVLNQSLDVSTSPANLATRALGIGMVPAQSAAFLRLSDGKVIGVAKPASAGPGFTVVGAHATPVPAAVKPTTVKPTTVKPTTVAPAAVAPAAVQPTQPVADPSAANPSAANPAEPAER